MHTRWKVRALNDNDKTLLRSDSGARSTALEHLSEIFHSYENYDAEIAARHNIGFRSARNLGVWLLIYTLLSDEDKDSIKQMLFRTGIAEQKYYEALLYELSLPEVLLKIIEDYKEAGGTFKFFVPEAQIEGLKETLRERGLEALSDYLKPGSVKIEMENDLKFNWAGEDRLNASTHVRYSEGECLSFNQSNIPFLNTTSTDPLLKSLVKYCQVTYDEKKFHVAFLHTKEEGQAYLGNVCLIEPLVHTQEDLAYAAQNSWEIISLASAYLCEPKNKAQLTSDLQSWKEQNNTHLQIEFDEYINSEYSLVVDATIKFPKLNAKLQTVEKRLGIYSLFSNKMFAGISLHNMEYCGKRALSYDAIGGAVRNVERVGTKGVKFLTHVKVSYQVSDSFVVVYSPPSQSDLYRFLVQQPDNAQKIKYQFAAEESEYEGKNEFANFCVVLQALFKGTNSTGMIRIFDKIKELKRSGSNIAELASEIKSIAQERLKHNTYAQSHIFGRGRSALAQKLYDQAAQDGFQCSSKVLLSKLGSLSQNSDIQYEKFCELFKKRFQATRSTGIKDIMSRMENLKKITSDEIKLACLATIIKEVGSQRRDRFFSRIGRDQDTQHFYQMLAQTRQTDVIQKILDTFLKNENGLACLNV